MQALSFPQPWAWALVEGHRLLDNRMEPSVAQVAKTLIGKDVAVHANLTWRDYAKAKLQALDIVVPMKVALPAGAIVAVATLKAVCVAGQLEQHLAGAELAAARRWANGPWCIIFGDVRPLAKPVKTTQRAGSGMAFGGFWPLTAADERKVLDQVTEAA
jgi:hypothetical protein